MIKIGHSLFALPFAVMGAFLAGRQTPAGRPQWGQLALVVLCMVAARCAAMTFNRIVDTAVDARNPRTRGRALPAGLISKAQAWTFFAASAVTFVVACAGFELLYDNGWPILLAVPVLLILCGYSYCKWYTRWSHFFLGGAIALSPAAAWIAVHPGSLGWTAALLVTAVAMWIGGFDIIYACQDLEFDRREGLYSLPAGMGPAAALWIARSAHALTVALLAGVGLLGNLGWLYWLGVALVALLLIIENCIVRSDDFSRVNLAFFTVNGAVSLVLGAVSVTDILLNLDPVFRQDWLSATRGG